MHFPGMTKQITSNNHQAPNMVQLPQTTPTLKINLDLVHQPEIDQEVERLKDQLEKQEMWQVHHLKSMRFNITHGSLTREHQFCLLEGTFTPQMIEPLHPKLFRKNSQPRMGQRIRESK